MKAIIAAVLLLLPCAASAEELQTITVRPGDTLWSISNTYLKDPRRWNEILKYNRLPSSDPSIALPGMQLKVPVSLIKEQYRAAKLVYYLNEVMYRRTGASDWNQVAVKMDLFKSDTVRTRVDARADIKFYTGEILNLYPNTLVVLRPPDKKNVDVNLMAGEIRAVRSRVVTASAHITPKTKDTEFGAKLKDDLTTMVQVYKGKADVEAQGKTVEVAAGFATEVKMDMAPEQPVKLPPLPELEQSQTALASGSGTSLKTEGGIVSLNMQKMPRTPGAAAAAPAGRDLMKGADGAKVPDVSKGTDANEILKMISVGNPVQSYHLQVSKGPDFATTVVNKNYDAFDKIDLNGMLPPGDYYMRIALVDLLGFEGKFSAPRRITVGK